MVLPTRVMCFVDWDCSVHNLWSYGLLVDNRLHSLVDVVVDMLAFDPGSSGGSVPGFVRGGGVFELGRLLLESRSSGLQVVMFELLMGNIFHLMVVLFGEDFLVLDWLDGGVMVVLMDFAVNSLLSFFMMYRFDMVPCYGAGD